LFSKTKRVVENDPDREVSLVKRAVLFVLLLVMVLAAAGIAAPAPKPLVADQMLFSYVNAPDPSYKWENGPEQDKGLYTVTDILLTSQTWHNLTWRHLLRIYRPKEVAYPGWMGLYITGADGEPKIGQSMEDEMLGIMVCQAFRAPLAILYHVPKQPIFDGKVEDQIISYTFAQFLKDGDPTWPLLFPMAKSAVRALDTLQAFTKREWKQDINSFLVFGGSKRGWTTWMTAAVDGGKRVKAIAPAVIDTLNMPKQLPHQLEMWGAYSVMIDDYTSKGLQNMFGSERGQILWKAVDPYTYRARFTMPKLLLLGSNDPYWATDALNFYWDDLPAPKWVLYDPNSGHGLDDIQRVVNTLGAYFRTIAGGKQMPQISWRRQVEGDAAVISITAPAAKGARGWVATADNLDFRPQRWVEVPATGEGGNFTIRVPRPQGKNIAVFGEVDFEADGMPYTLSTQNIIVKKPAGQ